MKRTIVVLAERQPRLVSAKCGCDTYADEYGPEVRFSQVMSGQPEYTVANASPRSIMILPEGQYNDSTISLPMLARPAVSPSIFGIPAGDVDRSTPPRARLAV